MYWRHGTIPQPKREVTYKRMLIKAGNEVVELFTFLSIDVWGEVYTSVHGVYVCFTSITGGSPTCFLCSLEDPIP